MQQHASNRPQTTGNLQKVLRGAVKEMVYWRDPFVSQLVSSFMFDIAQVPKNPRYGWTGLSVTLRQAATKGHPARPEETRANIQPAFVP